MDEPQNPLPDAPADGVDASVDAAQAPVEVAVTRSGGFAGMTRRWRAEPPPDQAPQWIALIAQCPWDAAPAVPSAEDAAEGDADGRPRPRQGFGADRFMWSIHARCGQDVDRETELADDELVGAWRELVDAVREWSRAETR